MNTTKIRELHGEVPMAVEFSYYQDGTGKNQRKALKRMIEFMKERNVAFWSAHEGPDPFDETCTIITAIFHADDSVQDRQVRV